MSIKKFEKSDVIRNTVKVHPHFKFKMYQGKFYINDSLSTTLEYGNLKTAVSAGASEENIEFDFSNATNSFNIALI